MHNIHSSRKEWWKSNEMRWDCGTEWDIHFSPFVGSNSVINKLIKYDEIQESTILSNNLLGSETEVTG